MLAPLSITVAATQRLGIETTGIEIIDESERTAQPSDRSAVVRGQRLVFGISYAAFVLGFGISFWQATLVTVCSASSPFSSRHRGRLLWRGLRPTTSRLAPPFWASGEEAGRHSWLVSIGWETFLAIMAVLATATVFEQLGWG